MIVQLSSGQGPVECEFAVSKLYEALVKEFPDIKMISNHTTKFSDGYTSIAFITQQDLSHLDGSVLWICKSPYRPNHKRKNWFVDVSIIPEQQVICRDENIKVEYFHCGGNGGQNVNKVETGVRLIHISTGITVTSTSERSQQQNRRDAMEKLTYLLREKEIQEQQKQTNSAWKEHHKILRGNPVRVYEGLNFKLVKSSRTA